MSAFLMMAMVVVFRSEDLLECNGDSISDSAHLASVGIWKQPKLFLQILCGASIYTAVSHHTATEMHFRISRSKPDFGKSNLNFLLIPGFFSWLDSKLFLTPALSVWPSEAPIVDKSPTHCCFCLTRYPTQWSGYHQQGCSYLCWYHRHKLQWWPSSRVDIVLSILFAPRPCLYWPIY